MRISENPYIARKRLRLLLNIINGDIDITKGDELAAKLAKYHDEGKLNDSQYADVSTALKEAIDLGGNVAVIIPCLNEEKTIRKVVEDYKEVLPRAHIYVYDNGSTDNTVHEVPNMYAKVKYCKTPGKGAVIKEALSEIKADVYVLCDGDDTYPPCNVRKMIHKIKENPHSIVIGNRQYSKDSMSVLHDFGNKLVRAISGNKYISLKDVDIMSGSRVFGKDFAKSFIGKYDGFEVETEMALFAVKNGFKVYTVDIPYKSRPEGSESKINTFKDGWKILKVLIRGK